MKKPILPRLPVLILATLLLATAYYATSYTTTSTQELAVAMDSLPSSFEVHGHRGARGLKPENTLPSIETALDLGVTALEFDLHFTSDDEVVVWHDPVISPKKCSLKPDAPTGIPDPDDQDLPEGSLAVRSMTATELGWFNCDRNPDVDRYPLQDPGGTELAGTNYSIVTLSELFNFVREYAASPTKSEEQRNNAEDVMFNIETKRRPDEPETIKDGFDGTNAGPFELRLLEVIEEWGVSERVVVQSFDTRSISAISATDPSIRTAILTSGRTVSALLQANNDAERWSPKSSTVTEDLVDEAHAGGFTVVPWTVNDTDELIRLIEAGVDGIITDRPDLLITTPSHDS